jgi:hypothetical protein
MQFDDLSVGKRLFVGDGDPICLGLGPTEIRGSAYFEAPVVVGDPPPFLTATLMVGKVKNSDILTPPLIPGALCTGVNNPYSLAVTGPSAFLGIIDANNNINAGKNITAQGEVMSRCGAHILSAKKNFDIPHPSKEGWRLRHTCPEAPYNDVYIRGRVTNKKHIELPDYWKDFVTISSITVNLTPICSHQNVIIKRIDEKKVYLQSQGNIPIDCFYHIYAERKDGETLISEYQGDSPAQYPGNNDEYSVSGYHYDIKDN